MRTMTAAILAFAEALERQTEGSGKVRKVLKICDEKGRVVERPARRGDGGLVKATGRIQPAANTIA